MSKKRIPKKWIYIFKNFFDKQEIKLLQDAYNLDPEIRKHFYDRKDSEGLITKMAS